MKLNSKMLRFAMLTIYATCGIYTLNLLTGVHILHILVYGLVSFILLYYIVWAINYK